MTRIDERFFAERLTRLRCSPEAKAYIVGVMCSFVRPVGFEMTSVVTQFALARERGDFVAFQRLGDWILWARSIVPTVDHVDVWESVGRLSYDACHRLLRGQWKVYEELADGLPDLTRQAHLLIVPGV